MLIQMHWLLPAATPLLFDVYYTLIVVGCQGFWRKIGIVKKYNGFSLFKGNITVLFL
jgi:hypothetical protein